MSRPTPFVWGDAARIRDQYSVTEDWLDQFKACDRLLWNWKKLGDAQNSRTIYRAEAVAKAIEIGMNEYTARLADDQRAAQKDMSHVY